MTALPLAGLLFAQLADPPSAATLRAREVHIRKQVNQLTPMVAKLFGAPNKTIPVKIVSRDAADTKLEQMEKTNKRPDSDRLSVMFHLLHLTEWSMQSQSDHRRSKSGGYSVAGFYDPKTKVLFILDDEPNAEKERILAHELAHAFQDMWVDLAKVMRTPNLDSFVAQKAVIEGQAEVAAKRVMESLPKDDDLGAQKLDGAGIEMGSHGLDPINFSYVAGAAFVNATASREDPVGVKLLKAMPATSAAILNPKLYEKNEPPVQGKIGFARLTGSRAYFEQTIGRAELSLLGKMHRMGDTLGEGWRGDRLEVVQFVDEYAAAWAILMTTEGQARETAYNYGSLLGRVPEGDSIRVEERAGTISSVSSKGPVVAILEHVPKKWVKQTEAATLAAFGKQAP